MTPGKRFAWESTGGLGLARHWFDLAPAPDGGSTAVAKGLEFVKPSFLARIMGWRLARDEPKSLTSDLAKIKSLLEGSGNTAPG